MWGIQCRDGWSLPHTWVRLVRGGVLRACRGWRWSCNQNEEVVRCVDWNQTNRWNVDGKRWVEDIWCGFHLWGNVEFPNWGMMSVWRVPLWNISIAGPQKMVWWGCFLWLRQGIRQVLLSQICSYRRRDAGRKGWGRVWSVATPVMVCGSPLLLRGCTLPWLIRIVLVLFVQCGVRVGMCLQKGLLNDVYCVIGVGNFLCKGVFNV